MVCIVMFQGLDLVCFADHPQQRLFAAVRGTDLSMNRWTTHEDSWPRVAKPARILAETQDMRSNMHLILGYGLLAARNRHLASLFSLQFAGVVSGMQVCTLTFPVLICSNLNSPHKSYCIIQYEGSCSVA